MWEVQSINKCSGSIDLLNWKTSWKMMYINLTLLSVCSCIQMNLSIRLWIYSIFIHLITTMELADSGFQWPAIAATFIQQFRFYGLPIRCASGISFLSYWYIYKKKNKTHTLHLLMATRKISHLLYINSFFNLFLACDSKKCIL